MVFPSTAGPLMFLVAVVGLLVAPGVGLVVTAGLVCRQHHAYRRGHWRDHLLGDERIEQVMDRVLADPAPAIAENVGQLTALERAVTPYVLPDLKRFHGPQLPVKVRVSGHPPGAFIR